MRMRNAPLKGLLKKDRIGEPIMNAPYKKPTGPVEIKYPRDGSIRGFKPTEPESYGKFHKKIMKDGPKNKMTFHKKNK
jgi:hypothetical protein